MSESVACVESCKLEINNLKLAVEQRDANLEAMRQSMDAKTEQIETFQQLLLVEKEASENYKQVSVYKISYLVCSVKSF